MWCVEFGDVKQGAYYTFLIKTRLYFKSIGESMNESRSIPLHHVVSCILINSLGLGTATVLRIIYVLFKNILLIYWGLRRILRLTNCEYGDRSPS